MNCVCVLPSFLSLLSTSNRWSRSFSLVHSCSLRLASWLYWVARLAMLLLSLWTCRKHPLKFSAVVSVMSSVWWWGECDDDVWSVMDEHTSSFSDFKQPCKVLIFSWSCRSPSCRPEFSLRVRSSWSYTHVVKIVDCVNFTLNCYILFLYAFVCYLGAEVVLYVMCVVVCVCVLP